MTNFIVFLTDDQGYGDLSCMGCSDFQTPNLDRMADEGARFTSWYSNSPVCSPSRAALLTGRYPGNAGVRQILAGHRTASGLPMGIPTIGSALQTLGYKTFMTGKWHLGLHPDSRPNAQGFDHWYGFMAGCIDYYSHIFYWGSNRGGPGQNPTHDLWEDNKEIWDNGSYFTEMITKKAVEYIRKAHSENVPFFLYVPYNAPHYPMHAPKEYMERFANLPWDRQIMAAMLSAVDDSIGEILREVKQLGLAETTCSFFTSDNGPSRESRNWLDGNLDPYYGGISGGLKGHKFSLYEGGIRLPGIMHWPNHIPEKQVLDAPCASMDIFPTLLDIAGGDQTNFELDGINILPYILGNSDPSERPIYWEMGNQTAVREGPWKLTINGQLVEHDEPECPIHLANLDEDTSEKYNLINDHPELTSVLKEKAELWRAKIEKRWELEFAVNRQTSVTH
jgi:arylsulfatase A-like enzyme